MNGFTRRDLLAASAAGVGLATAGCTGSDDSGDSDGGDGGDGGSLTPEDDADGETNGSETDGGDGADGGDADQSTRPDLPALQYVRVENDHDQAHAAHVLVENDEEIVHWSSHEVPAGKTVTLDRTWTSERGAFVVSVRIDDQTDWTQIDLTEERPNCYGVIPRITADGAIERLWERNPEGCGETPADGSN